MKKIYLILFLVFGLGIFVFPDYAHAARMSLGSCLYRGGELNPGEGAVLSLDCVPIMIYNVVRWALIFAGVVAFFFVLFGGLKLITSGGDQKAVEGARKTITWAIIGLIVVFLSFGAVRLVADLTGIDCLTRFGFLGTCGEPNRRGTAPTEGESGSTKDEPSSCKVDEMCPSSFVCEDDKCVTPNEQCKIKGGVGGCGRKYVPYDKTEEVYPGACAKEGETYKCVYFDE